MPLCPRCGAANVDSAAACSSCGSALQPPAPKRPAFKQTMVGIAAPTASPQQGGAQQGSTPQPAAPQKSSPQAPPQQGAPPGGGAPPAQPWGKTMVGTGAAPAQPAPRPPRFKQTMVGMAAPGATQPAQGTPSPPDASAPHPPGAAQQPSGQPPGAFVQAQQQSPAGPAQPQQQPPGARKQTMIGMAAPSFSGPAAPSPPQAADPSFTSTLVSGTDSPAAASSAPAPGAGQQQGAGAPGVGQPAALGAGQQTSAAPGEAPAPATGPAPGPAAPAAQPKAAPPAGLSNKKTMLGVAMPGIAPINPGAPKESPAPSPAAQPTPAAAPPAVPEAPAPATRRKVPRGAWVLLAVAALLLASAAVFAVLWQSPEPMSAEVTVDDSGHETLALTCGDCPDGTKVEARGASAIFADHEARLLLPDPLTVGPNQVNVSVQRPGIGRDEQLELSVPVEYRLRGDLSSLTADPPKLRVVARAVPGSSIVIDGTALSLDEAGRGKYEVTVAEELSGQADGVESLEHEFPYAVTTPDGQTHEGKVTLRLGIVPLSIEAPGKSIVIDDDDFVLAGRTLKDGTVEVEGRPITVDAAGRFSQRMNVSAIGETSITVRASAEDHAPRSASVRVKRVDDLGEHAKAFRKDALQDYDAVLRAARAEQEARVALDGQVVEARPGDSTTVILLDVERGCSETPCLSRVLYGDRIEIRRDESLSAFGRVTRSVDGPRTGDRIPEVAAEFLLLEGESP